LSQAKGDWHRMVRSRHGPASIQIKICGITNLVDATAAIDCGADVLGFNFFRGSKRYIDLASNRHWIEQLPTQTAKAAVLVNPTWEEAIELARLPFVQFLQLHGNEPPEFCQRLAGAGICFAKAIPMADDSSLSQAVEFFTRKILLDSSSAAGFGGTGRTFPWLLAERFIKDHPDFEVVLAGGLTPENVAEAVKRIRPFGIDVTTGVEASPGRKDRQRLQAFIAAARSA
jgi:phosphoribosylanthranilate isomerase